MWEVWERIYSTPRVSNNYPLNCWKLGNHAYKNYYITLSNEYPMPKLLFISTSRILGRGINLEMESTSNHVI